jgi:hypothetical protein
MPIWPAQPPESTAYPFNREERARLTVYRAAVAAGFYTDLCRDDHERVWREEHGAKSKIR